jgi:hypothetical protein
MQRNLEEALGSVARSVSKLEQDGKPARRVTLARTYDTTAEDLWEAVTSAERLPRWFLPVSGDLRLGGTYQFEGNAGGTITECEPPRYVAATWEFGGQVSWVEVAVAPEGPDRARLTLHHIALEDDHYWPTFGPGAAGVGWDLGLLGLGLHLADPEGERPDEEAFAASADGREFVVRVSEDWGRAAVEGGEDPEKAAAAARRTTAFYTGEASPEE